ncbi:nucleolar GTP-binding protein 1-like [Pyrus ussuriensis x Pyrus communis]|uniref:Nucleolar GTP-binding protein 1 n=1 Tax=Pyrus ussuriensis x Pyrus communis TaxID=2448454 RepID=A0A5N5HW97_9ROSA|nr:nucleolar GTP-binding protein 1-like [Pyrus ussuriensis x Pyrus communis]
MTVVPNGKDFIDIILSRTQRQTPTVVHKGYAISRLRQFYMRKVKYTQQNFHEKLSTIINEFPRLDDIHPFYGDLLHVLYNKDHLKACAWPNQYCKIGPSLAYLEQIRQHMARLPSIDPHTRTVLICDYPNVGKSSFINKITRADVDVQPYAFTTNITALAHLRAAVLFFLDISGSCGYSIAQQAALFHSIKSLFMNKPLIIVCNKADLQSLDSIPEEDKKLVAEMKSEAMKTVIGQGGEATNDTGVLLALSTLTEEGRLLNQSVELKMKSKKINDCLNRFRIAMPKPRDNKERPPCIPQAAIEAKTKQATEKEERHTERDLENENGGAGVYSASLKKHYILANDEWKEDVVPEIYDGHNVCDFVDRDILHRLEELEREEGLRHEEEGDDFEMDGFQLTPEEQKTLAAIRKKKSLRYSQHRMKKSTADSRPIVPRKFDKDREFTTKRMGRQLSKLGIDPTRAIEWARSRSVSRGWKRERSVDRGDTDGGDAMDVDTPNKKQRMLSRSRPRSRTRPPTEVAPGEGFKDSNQKAKALQKARKSNKNRNKDARRGEADRVIPTLKPKHLLSGKRSIGKTQRR